MTLSTSILSDRTGFQGLLTLIFGILVLIFPKILNYLIAIYLIITGLSAVLPYLK